MIKRIFKAILCRLQGQSSAEVQKEWAELCTACSDTYAYITRREDV